jgi:hypothetical protein
MQSGQSLDRLSKVTDPGSVEARVLIRTSSKPRGGCKTAQKTASLAGLTLLGQTREVDICKTGLANGIKCYSVLSCLLAVPQPHQCVEIDRERRLILLANTAEWHSTNSGSRVSRHLNGGERPLKSQHHCIHHDVKHDDTVTAFGIAVNE